MGEHVLSKAVELTCLNLKRIVVVDNVVVRLETAIVEVLRFVVPVVDVVSVRGTSSARSGVAARHVIEDRISDDLDSGGVAGIDHVFEGVAITMVVLEGIRDRL